jgi:hypothetical protein
VLRVQDNEVVEALLAQCSDHALHDLDLTAFKQRLPDAADCELEPFARLAGTARTTVTGFAGEPRSYWQLTDS